MDENFAVVHTNFEVLNLLFSALQGQFAANNVLSQVNHAQFRQDDIDAIKVQIEKVNSYFEEFNNGELFIQPGADISPREEELINFLSHFKGTYVAAANEVIKIASTQGWEKDKKGYQLLVAYFAWYVYSEDNFLKKLLSFYQANDLHDLAPPIELQIQRVANDVELATNFLRSVKNPDGPEEGFFPHLMFFVKSLPGFFYSKVHDLNQMIYVKADQFTYGMANIPDGDAEHWASAGFDPVSAGYWRAYTFTPEIAKKWQEQGFLSAAEAAGWYFADFETEEAMSWAQFMFTPLLALQWKQTKYDPEKASILISHGFYMPENLPADQSFIEKKIKEGFKP